MFGAVFLQRNEAVTSFFFFLLLRLLLLLLLLLFFLSPEVAGIFRINDWA